LYSFCFPIGPPSGLDIQPTKDTRILRRNKVKWDNPPFEEVYDGPHKQAPRVPPTWKRGPIFQRYHLILGTLSEMAGPRSPALYWPPAQHTSDLVQTGKKPRVPAMYKVTTRDQSHVARLAGNMALATQGAHGHANRRISTLLFSATKYSTQRCATNLPREGVGGRFAPGVGNLQSLSVSDLSPSFKSSWTCSDRSSLNISLLVSPQFHSGEGVCNREFTKTSGSASGYELKSQYE
jgi:hypothetical protein